MEAWTPERRGVVRKAPLAAQEPGECALRDPRQLHDMMADKWQVSCMTLEWKMECNMPDLSPKQLNLWTTGPASNGPKECTHMRPNTLFESLCYQMLRQWIIQSSAKP